MQLCMKFSSLPLSKVYRAYSPLAGNELCCSALYPYPTVYHAPLHNKPFIQTRAIQ